MCQMSIWQATRISSTDLVKNGQKGTIIIRSHSDVNFLIIHGRSRYPSLNIWARNSVQAGKQLEHITGGLIKACLHDVVVKNLAVSDSQVILLCTYLAFFIRLLNDGRWNSQIDLLPESHQPLSGNCHLITIWFLSPSKKIKHVYCVLKIFWIWGRWSDLWTDES